MNDRDCESCKKFSRVDPYESEGYCEAKRIWVDPQEGEDCKMHEFTLWTASKYKDGTPIMSEPKPESNQLDSLEQRVDELSEEYDAALKIHGDTLEQHMNQINDLSKEYDIILEKHAHRINMISDYLEVYLDRICNLEHLYEQLISKFCAVEQHKGSNFCGNCTHAKSKDGVYTCKLLGGNIDPDSASCSMFELPF